MHTPKYKKKPTYTLQCAERKNSQTKNKETEKRERDEKKTWRENAKYQMSASKTNWRLMSWFIWISKQIEILIEYFQSEYTNTHNNNNNNSNKKTRMENMQTHNICLFIIIA